MRELISSRAIGESETSSSESEIGTRSGRELGVLGAEDGAEDGEDDTELIPGGDYLLRRAGVDGTSGSSNTVVLSRTVTATVFLDCRRGESVASGCST